jgi:phage terminase large subunit
MQAAGPHRLEDLADEERKLLCTPYGFAKFMLGLPIADSSVRRKVSECRAGAELFYEIYENDMQRQIVDAAGVHGAKVSARTANGAGKTTVIIPTIVYFAMTFHPRARVVLTSGVERQVRAQLFPALQNLKHRLPGWKYTDTEISAPNGSHAIGFATNDGGRFEGWHGNKNPFYDLAQHDGPLVMIVDEAKSVHERIFEAIDRCTYQHLMLVSSCGGSSGAFFRSHTSEAKFYRNFQLPASLCPHADHGKNSELIQKRGINDRLVRSKVFAEFMSGTEGTVVQMDWVLAAMNNPPAEMPGPGRRVFCDFAAGGDENVIAERRGNVVRIVAAWREKNTMTACGQFIDHFRKLGIGIDEATKVIAGDEGGLGKVMLDRLAEIGWRLQRENNGSKPRDLAYRNRGAEMWYEAAKAFEQRRVVLKDVGDRALEQLTARLGFTPSDGRLEIESKEDMRERGLESPDRADAIVGVLADSARIEPVQFHVGRNPNVGLLEQMLEEQGLHSIPGAHC